MLDFSNIQKHFLNITMVDGSVFLVCMPKKKIFEHFNQLQKSLKDGETENLIDDMYVITTEILSNNKQGKEITLEYVENVFDVEDLKILFKGYGEFIGEASSDPN